MTSYELQMTSRHNNLVTSNDFVGLPERFLLSGLRGLRGTRSGDSDQRWSTGGHSILSVRGIGRTGIRRTGRVLSGHTQHGSPNRQDAQNMWMFSPGIRRTGIRRTRPSAAGHTQDVLSVLPINTQDEDTMGRQTNE